MIEIELFFRIVQSAIRRKHIFFLKKQKCAEDIEVQLDGINVDVPAAPTLGKRSKKRKIKADRVKCFNKGVDVALQVLSHEFNKFEARKTDKRRSH